jgi:hypothetical protein
MVPTVAWMRQKFAEYNARYFGNRLPVPQFKVEKMTDRFGNYYLNADYNTATRKITRVTGNGVISLTNQYSRNENSLISTLLHEMIHEYVYLVMRIYPEDVHGREFMSVANKINADGWKVAGKTRLTNSDRENNGQNNASCVLLVLITPTRKDFKWWICKADERNRQAFVNSAKQVEGVQHITFYRCKSGGLEHVKSDPITLFGWGGRTYYDAVNKMAEYCGEDPSLFSGQNLIPIK